MSARVTMVIVVILGSLAALAVIATVVLAVLGRGTIAELVGITSTAIGALAGALNLNHQREAPNDRD